MMAFIRRIPVPMSALALGTAGLGNLLLPYSPTIRTFCGVTAAAIAFLVVLRIIFDFARVRAELRSPAALAVFPAFFMALMLLATYLKPYSGVLAKGVWIAALVLQLLIVAVFVARFVVSFKLGQVVPGWFLVFVGFVVASVTSPAFGMEPLGRVLLYVGILGYVSVLPVLVFRMIKGEGLPGPALPTVAIFAAPPSLCLVGYLAVAEARQAVVVYALLAAAIASLLYVAASLPRIVKVPFCPSYAALTVPVVISAIALTQSSLFFATSGLAALVPQAAIAVMDGLAAAIVLYVLVRYAALLAVPELEPQLNPAPAAS